MTRYGMLINTKKCVGCSACRIACQMKNHLDPEESFIKYHEIETGEYPNVYNEIVPTQCMHCEDAPCAAVCPTPVSYTHLDVYKRQAGAVPVEAAVSSGHHDIALPDRRRTPPRRLSLFARGIQRVDCRSKRSESSRKDVYKRQFSTPCACCVDRAGATGVQA